MIQKIKILFSLCLTLLVIGCARIEATLNKDILGSKTFEATISTVEVSSATVVEGSTTTITLTTKDKNGNIFVSKTPLSIAFSATGGSSSVTFGPVVDHGDGTYTCTMTGGTPGTALKVTATINNAASIVSDDDVLVVPNFSMTSSYTTVSANTVAAGSTVNVVFHAYDASNVAMTQGGLPVSFELGTGTSTGTFDPVVDNGDGTYSSVFHAVTAGTLNTITGKVGTLAVTSSLPSVTVTAGPAHVISVIGGNNQSATVNTSLLTDLSVVVKDAYNNVVPSQVINWQITSGGGSLTTASNSTSSLGLASNQLLLPTTSGTKTITATVGATALVATFTATANPGLPASLSRTSGNGQTASVGSVLTSTPYVVTAYDSYGNTVPSVILDWAVTLGNGSIGQSQTTTNSSGSSSAVPTLGTTSGSNTVSVTIHGSSITQSFTSIGTALTTISSVAWDVTPSSTYTASNSVAMASFAAKLLDAHGNTILSNSTTTATLSLNSGTGSLGGTLTRTASSGIITFADITYTKAEAISLRVSENTTGSLLNATSPVTVSPNSPDSTQSSVTSSTNPVANDGIIGVTLTFTIKDAYGNVIPNQSVVFAASGTGNILTQPAVTNSSGQTTGTIKSTDAGTKAVTITTPVLSNTINIQFAVPSLSIANASSYKGSNITFTVTQSVLAGADVTFNYATSDGTAVAGTNYNATSSSGTITAGQTSTTFSVGTIDNSNNESDLTFTATLSTPSANATLGSSSATGTILDTLWMYDFTSCTLPSDFTLTNSSLGMSYFNSSGVMQIVSGSNVPRFDYDPATLKCRGLLIEPSSGNTALYSTNFANAVWISSEVVKTPNLAAPLGLDNSQTVVSLTENSNTGTHGVRQNIDGGSSSVVTFSTYVKAPAVNSSQYFELWVADSAAQTNGCRAVFDIQNGSVASSSRTGTTTNVSGSITNVVNGWYRAHVYCRFPSALGSMGGHIGINLMNSASGSNSYAGNGANTLYFWAPQSEWGKGSPTSYLPTTGALMSRGIEKITLNKVFSSWFNYSNMTLSLDFSRPTIDNTNAGLAKTLWTIEDGSNNSFNARIQQTQFGFYGTKSGSASSEQATVTGALTAEHRIYQAITSFANSGTSIYQSVNGVLSSAGTLATTNLPDPAVLTRFATSQYVGTSMHYRRLIYRPRAIASNKLNALTNTYIPSDVTSTIVASGPTTADGVSASTVTVTIKNSNSVGLPGYTPALSVSGGTGNTLSSCTPSDMNGVSTCFLRSNSTGTKTITITSPVTAPSGTAVFN